MGNCFVTGKKFQVPSPPPPLKKSMKIFISNKKSRLRVTHHLSENKFSIRKNDFSKIAHRKG
jgi:hypothetical protein